MTPTAAVTPASVLLRGTGVAVATAAHLLGRAGIAVQHEAGQRRPVPAIMLSDPALALLRDVFGNASLLAGRPRITKRVVRWGSEAVAMPHGAVVASEDDLAAALATPLGPGQPAALPAAPADFTLHAMPPFPAAGLLRCGERLSTTALVTLRTGVEPATCWIEAVDTGWLFLIPEGDGRAWLLAVGDAPDVLLGQAPLIGPLVDTLGAASGQFDTSPRLLGQLAGAGWLACGTAAIAFDPICGDGTAQAAREGILASAVVSALAAGEDAEALATHYHSLLLAALRRHLQLSLPFYANGGSHRWWHEQYAATRAGHERTTALLAQLPEPRFALNGLSLVRRGEAA